MAERKQNIALWIFLGSFSGTLVLGLIIFVTLAPRLTVGAPISLPKVEASNSAVREAVTIHVLDAEQLRVQNELVGFDNLEKILLQSTGEDYSKRIYLRAEKNSDFQDVMKVMGRINTAGFSNVALVTDPVSVGSVH